MSAVAVGREGGECESLVGAESFLGGAAGGASGRALFWGASGRYLAAHQRETPPCAEPSAITAGPASNMPGPVIAVSDPIQIMLLAAAPAAA
ncbi:hypothetical protein, partial [Methylacidimicrobium cyclopophantes]|uniref:hypothetical protein n=1 Tax=Methylacidimicrobium cyclopophantes TaxID=1041766 RepID=UPI0011597172